MISGWDRMNSGAQVGGFHRALNNAKLARLIYANTSWKKLNLSSIS